MPYIPLPARDDLDPLVRRNSLTAGELNYQITSLVNDWLTRHGRSYDGINQVVGVLECAKLELYRRIAGPYEDMKVETNGDVYSKELLK